MTRIEDHAPKTWRELQAAVAQILREAGVSASVEKAIQTARGTVNVDVWAKDDAATPGQVYLIECKLWRRPVPKSVVHAFRTVVADAGANWGAIVSSRGFQSGALDAALYSNVRLLSWAEFEELLAARWYQRHFATRVAEVSEALADYTDEINSRIFRKADALPEAGRNAFKLLRREHAALAGYCMTHRAEANGWLRMVFKGKLADACGDGPVQVPVLPQRAALGPAASGLPREILDAQSLRTLLAATLSAVESANASFDGVFGERA